MQFVPGGGDLSSIPPTEFERESEKLCYEGLAQCKTNMAGMGDHLPMIPLGDHERLSIWFEMVRVHIANVVPSEEWTPAFRKALFSYTVDSVHTRTVPKLNRALKNVPGDLSYLDAAVRGKLVQTEFERQFPVCSK